MSVQSQIDRVKGNVSASYDAVEQKGGVRPENQNSDNLPQAIQNIPQKTGEDGFSPIVEMTPAEGGTNLKITDKTGAKETLIKDGESGVYYGNTAPEDPDVKVWINENEETPILIGTKTPEGGEIFNKAISAGKNAHAEGDISKATGNCSHAEGYRTNASGSNSHAEGAGSKAVAPYSHVEGFFTHAENLHAHAEGSQTCASGEASHAQGFLTVASGLTSHAEGWKTESSGKGAHAEGNGTISAGESQHSQGQYNIPDTDTGLEDGTALNKYAHIVGNGTYDARSNAHTLDWQGNSWYQGRVFCGGKDMDAPIAELNYDSIVIKSSTPESTKRFRITVDDTGIIKAEEIITTAPVEESQNTNKEGESNAINAN